MTQSASSAPRTCAEPGCGTHLASYNAAGPFCSKHGGTTRYDQDWQARAACRNVDTERFDVDVPSDGSMTGPVLAAKRLCVKCPVRRECLEYVFRLAATVYMVTGDEIEPSDTRFHDVVFAGLTGRERMRLHADPDRIERGLALLDVQKLMWPYMLPIGQLEEKEDAA